MDIHIEITTGNAACKSPDDVDDLLVTLAKRIKRDGGFDNITKIMDRNGNAVGTLETSMWDDDREEAAAAE